MKGLKSLQQIYKLPFDDRLKIFNALKVNLLNELYKDYDNKITAIRGGYVNLKIKQRTDKKK